jgi:hypothetical protein
MIQNVNIFLETIAFGPEFSDILIKHINYTRVETIIGRGQRYFHAPH